MAVVQFCSSLSLFLLLCAFSLTGLAKAQISCTVRSGSTLSTTDTSPWLSPGREFAFGFRKSQNNTGDNLFLLAIWFYQLPNQTIVWYANGGQLAPAGSQILLQGGQLVLRDHNGNQLWETPAGAGASCGAMLDNGNFALLNAFKSPVWETFDEPTDTILPGQVLNIPSNLTARKSDTDSGRGRFQLRFQPDGNLVLYSVSVPTDVVYGAYWATMTFVLTARLVFSEEGFIYLEDNRKRIFNVTRNDPGAKEEYYHLARLDSDGVFREYKHPRLTSKSSSCPSSWAVVNSIPDDICLALRSDLGSGACGYNSYCLQINGKPHCFCPDGYSYLDPIDPRKGCKPDFALPSCQTGGWETTPNSSNFTELENTDWPLNNYDLQIGSGVDKDTCKKLCSEDCFCSVAIYNGKNCWKKKLPLSNGRKSGSVNRTALLKVPAFPYSYTEVQKKDQSTLVIALSALLGSSVFLNCLLMLVILGALWFSYQKRLRYLNSVSRIFTGVRSCSYKELEQATGGFKQVLGKGSFGTVYKGVLSSGDAKRFVAVKKLNSVDTDGEREFRTEVSAIGQTHHKNLVRLLGFCDEGNHRLLVYEYMSNGSVASFLFGISRPDWNQRVQISSGIARGLMYLHEECSTQIIHCDIKPQNILLDENFTPRIADFGLAKLLLNEQTRVARTAIRGTIGYFAPEWFRKASVTVKVDVYSFGVVLLEIICCMSSVAFAMEKEEALIDWAYELYKEKKLDKLVENDEEAKNDLKRVARLVKVAIWCIQEDPSLRPSMKKVTQMLEGVTEVSVPPRPSMFRVEPLERENERGSQISIELHNLLAGKVPGFDVI